MKLTIHLLAAIIGIAGALMFMLGCKTPDQQIADFVYAHHHPIVTKLYKNGYSRTYTLISKDGYVLTLTDCFSTLPDTLAK